MLLMPRILGLLLVAGFVALVFYLPVVAAVLFVALVTFLAMATDKGFWNGVRLFLKEILCGW